MTSTPTPRTEAVLDATRGERGVYDELDRIYTLARELERENAAFREAIKSVSFLLVTHPHLWNEKIAHAFVLIHRDDPVSP